MKGQTPDPPGNQEKNSPSQKGARNPLWNTALISWKAPINAESDEAAVSIAEALMRALNGPQTADTADPDASPRIYYGEADLDYVENTDEGKIIHGSWHP